MFSGSPKMVTLAGKMRNRPGTKSLWFTKTITLACQMCDRDGLWVTKNGNPGRPDVR